MWIVLFVFGCLLAVVGIVVAVLNARVKRWFGVASSIMSSATGVLLAYQAAWHLWLWP